MKIVLTSIFVDDQDKALDFYNEKLGLLKKTQIPLGTVRWLTVVSPADPKGTELVLEPDSHPAVGRFKKALMKDGIPMISFAVDDVRAEFVGYYTGVIASWAAYVIALKRRSPKDNSGAAFKLTRPRRTKA